MADVSVRLERARTGTRHVQAAPPVTMPSVAVADSASQGPAQAEGSGIQAMLDDLDDIDEVDEGAVGAGDAAGDDEGPRASKRGRSGSDAAQDDAQAPVGDATGHDGFAVPAKRARPAGPSAEGGVPTGSVFETASLLRRPAFQRHMRLVDEALALPAPAAVTGIVEDHPEYILTVDSNHLLAELRDEAESVRAFIAALYRLRFAELAEVVSDPLMYSRVVRELRDTPADRIPSLAPKLEKLLPASTVMVITVSGSALDACRLTDDQLARLDEACDAAEAIASSRDRLLRFVESRMGFLAPNISALVGPRLASELVGLAGGVAALARIPACNIQVMGRSKQSANGLSRLSVKAHNGIVHEAPLVATAPPQLRQRAAKVLAAKVALAARVDAHGTPGSDATVGRGFHSDIAEKIAKWAEPPEVKAVKPLPIPEPKKCRKRGGKRFRRIKEKYGMTEVRKAANRLAVDQSATEYSESAMGNDGGMLAAGGAGRLRVAAKTQKNLLRTAAMRKAKARAGGGADDPLSGLASTIAFSHTSGMELVDPEAVRRRKAKATATAGYFDDAAGFAGAKKKPA